MDIVDVQYPKPFHLDVTGEHWKLIEIAFMRAPVVAVFPFVDQTLHIGERGAIVPASIAELVREADVGKLAMKESKSVIRYRDFEAAFWGHGTRLEVRFSI
jgi:hypothetical protein